MSTQSTNNEVYQVTRSRIDSGVDDGIIYGSFATRELAQKAINGYAASAMLTGEKNVDWRFKIISKLSSSANVCNHSWIKISRATCTDDKTDVAFLAMVCKRCGESNRDESLGSPSTITEAIVRDTVTDTCKKGYLTVLMKNSKVHTVGHWFSSFELAKKALDVYNSKLPDELCKDGFRWELMDRCVDSNREVLLDYLSDLFNWYDDPMPNRKRTRDGDDGGEPVTPKKSKDTVESN